MDYGSSSKPGSFPAPGPTVRQALPDTIVPEVDASTTGLRDAGFGAAFVLHAVIVVGLACVLGFDAVTQDGKTVSNPDANASPLDINAALIVRSLVTAVFVSAFASLAFFYLIKRAGGGLIRLALLISVGLQVAAGLAMLAFSIVPAIILLLLASLTAFYFWWVQDRIPFAAAHLEIAITVLDWAPSLITVSLLGTLAAGVWSILWALAAAGLERAINNGSGGGASPGKSAPTGNAGGVMVFVMLVSLGWGSLLCRNVIAFCAASTVGSWWFRKDTDREPVKGAVRRAVTTSFGTLSFGALVVAIVQAARKMADAARRRSSERNGGVAAALVVCLVRCLLSLIEAAAEWANHWAIVYAALTGMPFVPSGKAALQLFMRRGWTSIINSDLIGLALGLGGLATAAVAALAGGAVTFFTLPSSANRVPAVVIAAILSFCVGLAMVTIMSGLIVAAGRSVFVCWAMSPDALEHTNPAAHATLLAAWQAYQPGACDWLNGGGSGGYPAGTIGQAVAIPVGYSEPPPPQGFAQPGQGYGAMPQAGYGQPGQGYGGMPTGAAWQPKAAPAPVYSDSDDEGLRTQPRYGWVVAEAPKSLL
jgi:hypothetical protein